MLIPALRLCLISQPLNLLGKSAVKSGLGAQSVRLPLHNSSILSGLSQSHQLRASSSMSMRYLSQSEAVAVDEALMVIPGFSVDQLMELAGLSVAAAVATHFPKPGRVLCVCGPGNNGGDGLVAARHLWQFGWQPTVLYPKRSSKPLFVNLAAQMDMMEIPVLEAMPKDLDSEFDVILDAIFGFSFSGSVRAPFDTVLPALQQTSLPVVSVDIPSGWDVEQGPPAGVEHLKPEVLVSLTMPKKCASHFNGAHYLGGRFVPPTIAKQFNFKQPAFPALEQVVKLSA